MTQEENPAMFDKLAWRRAAGLVVGVASMLAFGFAASAQTVRDNKKAPTSAVFAEAMARAKESGRPLIVFGVSEGCVRCAALKQVLATQSDLKLLMTQYVSTELPFGGREFAAVYGDIIRQDAKYNQAIGAPSVFIFTAKGAIVYAGPNNANGMPPGDEFKKLLITGIEKNGGLRSTAKLTPGMAADVAKARKLLSENQPQEAAKLISKCLSEEATEAAELGRAHWSQGIATQGRRGT
jgi:hypothetical protein